MSTRQVRPEPEGRRRRRGWGAWALLLLFLHAACATSRPGERGAGDARHGPSAPPAATEAPPEYALEWLEPGPRASRPVPIEPADFQRALRELSQGMRLPGMGAREQAEAWLAASKPSAPEVETVGMAGVWLLEAYRGRTYGLVPLSQTGPVPLLPEAEEALRVRYLRWCEPRGGGDCLGLLEDGPHLRAEDRRTLALAVALGGVLEETRGALAHEVLDARQWVALVVWTVALYCALWTVPEPTSKALAAGLTVVLVGWLGLDTVWGLMDGWSRMAEAAHEATTFEEVRAAGEDFGSVLGADAARALVMAVTTLAGRTLGEVAGKVRALPGYGQAAAQWEAQGGAAVLGEGVAREEALAVAVERAEAVAVSARGPVAVVLLKTGAGSSAGAAPGGRSVARVLRHRGGNQQVELSDGQRWHLPRGKSVADVPARDPVGDALQDAVTRAASEWGPDKLSDGEKFAIKRALERGKYWLARLLEREARGRFVEENVRLQFEHLYEFSPRRGVDVIDLATGRRYEILSGTESNLARHGRRMATEFFRMLTF